MGAANLHELRLARAAPGERVDCVLSYDAGRGHVARGALVCSPSPLLGGDLENNVVRALADACADAGLAALRFDYRSVGRSEDVNPGEARFEHWSRVEAEGDRTAVREDADEALRRLADVAPPVLLAGYSFGAWVALDLAVRTGSRVPLVLVAPPFGRLDLQPLRAAPAAVLMIVAEHDTLTPAPADDVLRARFPRARVERVPGADHFFLGCEDALAPLVRAFLSGLGSSAGPHTHTEVHR